LSLSRRVGDPVDAAGHLNLNRHRIVRDASSCDHQQRRTLFGMLSSHRPVIASAVRGSDQRTNQSCKLDVGTRPSAKPLLVWGCSNDLELPVEAATQQELRPPRVIGRGHNDDRTPPSSRCEVAYHAGLSSGRVRIWLRAQHFEPLGGGTQLVRGLPARIAAIGDDQHRCDLLVQQHEGLAEALTTATGEDNQGVGWMGGIG
jgi:hypothetical protein